MKFETVQIHFLSDFLICCHPENLLPWQRDITTSLYCKWSHYKGKLKSGCFGRPEPVPFFGNGLEKIAQDKWFNYEN